MLAALLLNRIGNTAGRITQSFEDKANIALDGLRRDYFDRNAKIKEDLAAVASIRQEPIYRIKSPIMSGEPAAFDDRAGDEELALLFILAEL